MKTLRKLENGWIAFKCVGCDEMHALPVDLPENKDKTQWKFNGDYEKPTLIPSVLVNKGAGNPTKPVCHSFVRDGEIDYLPDCTHAYAGKKVALPSIE